MVVLRRDARREVVVLVVLLLGVRWVRWAKAMVVIKGVVHGPVVGGC